MDQLTGALKNINDRGTGWTSVDIQILWTQSLGIGMLSILLMGIQNNTHNKYLHKFHNTTHK